MPPLPNSDIPEKANRILYFLFFALLMIALRLWYLSVIQHEAKIEESRKPQRRVITTPAPRATIRDRFNIPLATNKIQYRIVILYSELQQIRAVSWEKAEDGTRVKRFLRREYVSNLAKRLSQELDFDEETLEDLIYSKAALYFNLPFTLQDDLTEEQYYRLKMLEKDWLGIHVQSVPKRTYPLGKVAADVIGYMGAINQHEYESIIGKIKSLEKYLKAKETGEEIASPPKFPKDKLTREYLKELRERAYTLHDSVGKAGIEGRYDAQLRGFRGKKEYYSDAKGNYLKELPGTHDPLSGQRILLTISAELQEYAERLLIQNERIRQARPSHPDDGPAPRQPWIKGGAIVAMDPNTGEILALASYPRVDPNDFIPSGDPDLSAQKQQQIQRWLESEKYLGQIWDQRRPLERERFHETTKEYYDESLWLDWDHYLESILPDEHPVLQALREIDTLQDAIQLQCAFEEVLAFSGQNNPYWLLAVLYPTIDHSYGSKLPKEVKEAILENLEIHASYVQKSKAVTDKYTNGLSLAYDRVFLVDLCRVAVLGSSFPHDLLQQIGSQSLATYKDASAAYAVLEPVVRNLIEPLFHDLEFKPWRQRLGKDFIREKRKIEREEKLYTKPYINYYEAEEERQFQQFWKTYRLELITAFILGEDLFIADEARTLARNENQYTTNISSCLEKVIGWQQEISQGAYPAASWQRAYKTLKKIVETLPQDAVLNYLATLRGFQHLDRPLLGKYPNLRNSNGQQLEKHLATAFYPRYGFGYGRSFAYRQALTQGSIFKLVTAYATLRQQYELADLKPLSTKMLNPLTINESSSIGSSQAEAYRLDGTPIPARYKGGRLLRSMRRNIGQVDIVQALGYSSNPYFMLLAGDILRSPDDLITAAKECSYGQKTGIDLPGEIAGKLPNDLATNRSGLYTAAIGQHSLVVNPLQTAVMLSAIANGGKIMKPQIILALAGSPGMLPDMKISRIQPQVIREIPMPPLVRHVLLEGMERAVENMQKSPGILHQFYREYPEVLRYFLHLESKFIGKTSTAEQVERLNLDLRHGAVKYTHTWFGGISLVSDGVNFVSYDPLSGRPDLVVVVYLHYGQYGKEGAPVAAQVVKKWQEIQKNSFKDKDLKDNKRRLQK